MSTPSRGAGMPRATVTTIDAASRLAAHMRDPRAPAAINALIATAGAMLGIACGGEIGTGVDPWTGAASQVPGNGVIGAVPGSAGSGAVPAAVSAADNAMRAQNANLFDVALKYFP